MAGNVWSRFWISIRSYESYQKQQVKKILGSILGLAWLKFAMAALDHKPSTKLTNQFPNLLNLLYLPGIRTSCSEHGIERLCVGFLLELVSNDWTFTLVFTLGF